MRQNSNELLRAVRYALYVGTTAAVGLSATATPVFAQEGENTEKLETIVVTGSRIRRVDLETASPVVSIDKATIEKSGKLTVGDLVQELPSVAGAATNPRVNNGGGAGASTIELRGLGVNRTLVLLNGKRAVSPPFDVNSIPANMIERIEVLKDGASAVYGSDAIAGVVNFILRSDYQGAEFMADYGVSDRDDGEREGASFTFGHSSDRGSIMGGINYNKYDSVSSADREFAKDATYLSSASIIRAGSSRNPQGRIFLPAGNSFGCGSVSRTPGTSGASLSDYRCYSGARDAYNYQSVNLVMTPQERANAFVIGNYKLSDSVEVYANYFHNETTSNFAIAPLPFDAIGDGVTISRDNYYNPFGIDLGAGNADGLNMLTRFTGLGQRRGNFSTSTDQALIGFKGSIGDTSWTWDASYNYGHYSQMRKSLGYVYYEGLRSALGPSFRDPVTGVITCGTPDEPIAGCVPFNIFAQNDPAQVALLSNYSATPYYNTLYLLRQGEVNVAGELFEMPAGVASLAVGVSHRKEYQDFDVDYIAITRGEDGTCFISQEACSTPLNGGYTVKEAYAELFLPILKDVTFAQSLNLIVGSRYSDYNTFGDTTNSKVAVEWRPIEDVLLRGTVQEVFRAPNISELYAGATGSAPSFADPCRFLSASELASHSNACQNVPVNYQGTGLSQTSAVVSGAVAAGIDLVPEEGKTFDFGVVYDPSWLEGLSVNVDVWRIYLNDTITPLGAQTIVNSCFQDNTSFCNLIHRTAAGDIQFISSPTANLGRLDTKGVDFGFKYRLPETSIGNFGISFESTYIAQYDNDKLPERSDDAVVHVNGTYNRDYGNYARWRALAGLSWGLGSWDANWRVRYIGGVNVGNEDERQGTSADGSIPGVELHYGAHVEHNLAVGYNIEPINTRLDIGIDNVFDKQPPLFFQNNVINANTDVNTYDTVGRYFWGRVTVKF
ncbi:TonB-dependent receptor plug domain-containing protein [Tahibacter amnicola]|uniref:TonB-dependent receptor n=1 Tax=Tahibacter amnicola TaxID=2976241 RepID=A0ABY6BCU4_9GAMM|nr:TonB-dependent receptor [Tahibacter amnicola]UXI67622.1 TonB-dependent receptor [Tahibacter amnicola]